MLAAIATFIAAYTLVTSSPWYQQLAGESLVGKAVALGTKLRLMISLISAPLLLSAYAMAPVCFLAPDFWAGVAAVRAVEGVGVFLGVAEIGVLNDGSDRFLVTYAVAVLYQYKDH